MRNHPMSNSIGKKVEPRVRCPVEVDTLIKEVVISPNSSDSDVEEIGLKSRIWYWCRSQAVRNRLTNM